MRLVRLRQHNVDEKDWAWLEVGLKSMPYGYDLKSTMEDLMAGMLQFWRLEGEAEGILLTRIMEHPWIRELEVVTMAGKGVVKNLHLIYQALKSEGRNLGCKVIGGDVSDRRLLRKYTRLGAKPIAVKMVMEISDG